MKFVDALQEKAMLITGKTLTTKKLRLYKGINVLLLDEGEPPDVHGIPKELEAYGRGGFIKASGQIFLDGGQQGSREGHPSYIEDGFYWGVDKDALWTGQDGVKRKGVAYIRGRAGTNPERLEKNLNSILDLMLKRIPK